MRPELEPIAVARRRAGILLDFDGTLAEIVPTPEEATPVDGAVEVLRQLADAYRAVAIVSGRRAADVSARIEGAVRCYGLYGLEDEGGPRAEAEPLLRMAEEVLPEVRRLADAVPGARLEHKGFHLAVHYRGAPSPDAEPRIRRGLEPLAERAGMAILEGKQVLELAPRGGPSKGDVVRAIARDEELEAVLYAGDDVGDLDAFAAVDALDLDAAVTVAVRSAETPPEVLRAAALDVPGPTGLVRVLRELA